MAELSPTRLIGMRVLYVALALVVIFFHLLPLDTAPRRWSGPDLLLALTFAWAMLRPDHVPIISVAAVMLLADLVLQRPPGLMAALVVLGVEYLRNRVLAYRCAGFAREWVTVALVMAAILAADRVALAVLDVPQAQLGLALMRTGLTIVIYPLVVLFCRTVLGLRRPQPGESLASGAHR